MPGGKGTGGGGFFSSLYQTETTEDKEAKERQRPVGFGKRLHLFFSVHWRGLVIVLVPLVALPVILGAPYHKEPHRVVAYALIVMALYWMTECLPLPVTSWLPAVLFPTFNIMSTSDTVSAYFNDTVFMFLGSLFLAASIEQSGLHVRLALGCIRLIGYSHYKLLLAMCTITTFVSMWIANTAATSMMIPIIFAVLKVFSDLKLLNIFDRNAEGDEVASKFTTCYFCAATYSATIGGIGTLVGTGTNLTFKGLYLTAYPGIDHLSFPKHLMFAAPVMLVLEVCVYLSLIVQYFGFLRPGSKSAREAKLPPEALRAAKEAVLRDTKKIGRIKCWEIMVLILFTLSVFGFFARSPDIFTGWGDALVQWNNNRDPKNRNLFNSKL